MRAPAPDPFRLPGPLGGTLGLPAGAVAAMAAWASGGSPVAGAVLAAVAAAALAAVTTPVGALGAAALCWACADGFVVNRFGTLGGGARDLWLLAVVAAAAAAAWTAGALVRRLVGRPIRRPRLPRDYAGGILPVPPRHGTARPL
ncbi:hypothetical protein BJF78_24475 [Pseudonocardia sp. CNS-139]|nr:hypothetical protein BJF78_24475 [Pseudonocardia sp. CNS-139]